MLLRFTRVYEVEVSKDVIVAACQSCIDDWGYDEDVPPAERTTGIDDVIQRLDNEGHLVGADEDGNPSCVSGLPDGFFTAEQLSEILAD